MKKSTTWGIPFCVAFSCADFAARAWRSRARFAVVLRASRTKIAPKSRDFHAKTSLLHRQTLQKLAAHSRRNFSHLERILQRARGDRGHFLRSVCARRAPKSRQNRAIFTLKRRIRTAKLSKNLRRTRAEPLRILRGFCSGARGDRAHFLRHFCARRAPKSRQNRAICTPKRRCCTAKLFKGPFFFKFV